MAAKIKWSPKAFNDLRNVYEFISRDSNYYASLVVRQILFLIRQIPQFPKAGRVVPEYRDPTLREKIYKNYRIVYRLKDGVMEIAAICHSSKLLTDLI